MSETQTASTGKLSSGDSYRVVALTEPSAGSAEGAELAVVVVKEPPVPIQYSLAYLDYTMRTNQTNEVRLTKILTVALGGLAASGVLLESVLSPMQTFQLVRWLLFIAAVAAAVLFIAAIYRIIKGIAPTTQDAGSHFLTDNVVAHGAWDLFAAAINSHRASEAATSVLRENFAMAGVVNARQQVYKRAVALVTWAGGLLVVTYFFQVLARFLAQPSVS